jgi:hypothetical protein
MGLRRRLIHEGRYDSLHSPACTNHLLRRLVVGHGGKDLLDGGGADEQRLCVGQNKRRISSG